MDQSLVDRFKSMSDQELLSTYANDFDKYRSEAIVIMEQLLQERGIEFEKKNPALETTAKSKGYQFNGKRYRKVLLWMLLLSIPGLFGEAIYLEGKLFSDDPLGMFLYYWYIAFSFPSILITRTSQELLAVFFAYIVNISLVAVLVTYCIDYWKSIKVGNADSVE